MKEQAISLAKQAVHPADRLNLLREYLQAFVLRSLHESEAFTALSFLGGTALRFLFGLPRFSEDLDFSVEDPKKYHLKKWLDKLKRDMMFAGFDVSIVCNVEKTVHQGWIKVAGLLQEVGLAGRPEQNISVKIEVDTDPPAGAQCVTTVVNKYFLIALQHHDLSSLMAGKICALCARPYTKGRDFYDLFWYRAQRPPVEPNLVHLNAALKQTTTASWPATEWKTHLLAKIHAVDWKQVVKDVAPFLENPQEKDLLTVPLFETLLK